jgi:hypothetical protein
MNNSNNPQIKITEQAPSNSPAQADTGYIEGEINLRSDLPAIKSYQPQDIDFQNSSAVISSAQKFIIPIPAFGSNGEQLVYPDSHAKAGEPILDWQNKPIGESGIVFYNKKDSSWQAAAGDGTAVVIINQVTREQAQALTSKIKEFKPDPNHLTLGELKEVLQFAAEELGLSDMYNSDRNFIKSKMTPVDPKGSNEEVSTGDCFGFMKRDDRDICQAVYLPGTVQFEGPAATPQLFENGAVIVKQGESIRGIQPETFAETYTYADGTRIDLSSLEGGT